MTITPDKVLRTDMTKNLTPDEAVAVNDFGHVLSRADRATIESAYPGHAIFGAKDFAALDYNAEQAGSQAPASAAEEPKARKAKVEEPVAPVVEEPNKAEETPAKPELVLDPDGNPPNDKAPAAAEPANEDAVVAAEGERPESVESASAKDPLDHDNNGKKGGAAKSKAKTASN